MRIDWLPRKAVDARPYLAASEKANSYVNGGPAVRALEDYLRRRLVIRSDKCIVCVANGTVALWAVAAAMELEAQGKMRFATQAFTFPSSAQGPLADAAIIDVDAEGGLDLSKISPADADGLIVTNAFGNLVDVGKYVDWCERNGKALVFDNAATPYSFYRGENALNYGNAATVSFHHTKPFGFGEGGCIVADARLELALRRVINFGIDNKASAPEWHPLGGNYKMSDIAAAHIHAYLESEFDRIAETHRARFLQFRAELPGAKLYPNSGEALPSCIAFFSECPDRVIKVLAQNGVHARKYYAPLAADCPVAAAMYARIVCIPCHIDIDDRQFECIKSIVEATRAADA